MAVVSGRNGHMLLNCACLIRNLNIPLTITVTLERPHERSHVHPITSQHATAQRPRRPRREPCDLAPNLPPPCSLLTQRAE